MSEGNLRKRRGVVRGAITRFYSRLDELEAKAHDDDTLGFTQQAKLRLKQLDSEFKTHHYDLVDVINGEEALEREQAIFDEHDDHVALLSLRIQKLIAVCTALSPSSPYQVATKRLLRVREALTKVSDAIAAPITGPDSVCLLHQHQEQLSDLKKELGETRHSLLSLELNDGGKLDGLQTSVEEALFDCSLSIKKALRSQDKDHPTADGKGVKLPKLEVPTFDGDILGWKTFWEQFAISVHERPSLTDSEKLVYLQHALKSGSAKQTIEGLSRSGNCYVEAVECLQARYDRPRVIHQTHVKMIMEAPPLKEGSGKEIRRLHDTVLQHLRALKAMDYEPSGPFITSILELKLDTNTMFEWQKHSQASNEVPHFQKLLEFLNLRAQASEQATADSGRKPKNEVKKTVATFIGTADPAIGYCVVCKTTRHPLYICQRFKNMAHEKMLSTLRTNNLCINCLRPGHHSRECQSSHRCKKCQKLHHTLLHLEYNTTPTREDPPRETQNSEVSATALSAHAAMGISANMLLMTCYVQVEAPDGSFMKARALLDSASSASFVSERLAQALNLPRSSQSALISGVAGLVRSSPIQSLASLKIATTCPPGEKIGITGIVVPRVTCDLPLQPVDFDLSWNHLSGIQLADPNFGIPGKVDLLLGVEVFATVMLDGRRMGPPNSPIAFETKFGWVLAGSADTCKPVHCVTTHHTSVLSGDDILRKFWELEERSVTDTVLSPEEHSVVQHFKANHTRVDAGRFMIPLPKKPDAKQLGESRSQAVNRFHSLERALHAKGMFGDFEAVIEEYFTMGHAEPVPPTDLNKRPEEVFYLPMHVVHKESSTTTKVRAVFDASAKTSTGVSLNDTLLVGPTVHSSLLDVLLRFRLYRVALTTDVSRMYRGIELAPSDRDLHRFVWRKKTNESLGDFRMTRVTFGVSASSFAANMAVKQNASDFAMDFPLAYDAVKDNFYVDDGLTGADSVEETVKLYEQLRNLFDKADLLLRKWNSSEPQVLEHIPSELRDKQPVYHISEVEEYTKTLGVEWNATSDHFRLTVASLPPLGDVTKRFLVSDIAKTYDALGWFSPSIIMAKILLQQLWEMKVEWDDVIPDSILDVWLQWRNELDLLSSHHVPRCYYPKTVHVASMQLHGFSDASERAYAGVIYLRVTDSQGGVHVSLVTSKTKVAPIKRLTIPRLELCGAHLLAQLLHHVKEVFRIPLHKVHAWTDSTIVVAWLAGDSRRFKTYVGNRVSQIVDLIAPDRWKHVSGAQNPADCASRGLFPSELLDHKLWWDGPDWLCLDPTEWPQPSENTTQNASRDEEKEICLHTTVTTKKPLIGLDRYSSFSKLKRTTAWMLRFLYNCRAVKRELSRRTGPLGVQELHQAETYWVLHSQESCFIEEILSIKAKREISRSSPLLLLHPFLDPSGILRVGGREQNAKLPYCTQHPIIVSGKHPLTKLLIQSEHLRLLHAGPTLLTASLCRRFHIIGCRKSVRSITRSCVTCRHHAARPQPPLFGQLPMERITPDAVFDRVGIDYAGPLLIKLGHVRKPTIVKAYVCVFVSLSVKATHLELVSDMTTEAFIAALRRFIARRGKPSLLWSDHGSNFIGATSELKQLFDFLSHQKTQGVVADFCSAQNIAWKFIPQHAPHFGGLWEAAVKSMKGHLKRVVGDVKLTFEELTTVLAEVEACLNSRPLTPLPSGDDDGVEALTPGHFLIGRPLESLPDPSFSYRKINLLRRWHLCQALVRHFWQRWSSEYLVHLQKFSKWHRKTKNLTVGDVVVLREDGIVPAKWPMARVTGVHPGKDGVVRVVDLKTPTGTYTRPVVKVAPLITTEQCVL